MAQASLRFIFGISLLGLSAGACDAGSGGPSAPADAADESFIQIGKADFQGDWEAYGVALVDVANTLSERELTRSRRKGGVGLSSITAGHIVKARPLLTLDELDAVPFVGPKTVTKLGAWARENDIPGAVPLGAHAIEACEDGCSRVAEAYEDRDHWAQCTDACQLQYASREDLCLDGFCDGAPTSAMVRLYADDAELVTRLDDGGVVRVDHTLTAFANRGAAAEKRWEADRIEDRILPQMSDGLKQLMRENIRELRRAARKDTAQAVYHGFLAGLNTLSGRE